MIGISAWIMLLATVRDRAALVMAFILPPMLFIVFAAIFAGTTGKDLKLKLGVRDAIQTEDSRHLVEALGTVSSIRLVVLDHGGEADLSDLVQQGTVDAGILIRGDLRKPSPTPPVVIIQDETKVLAGVIARGQVESTVGRALPDVAMSRVLDTLRQSGRLDPRTSAVLAEAVASGATKGEGTTTSAKAMSLVATQTASGVEGRHGNVLYYAASVTAIFLLFSAVHGALTVVDERTSGIAERLRLGFGGLAASLAGKMLFLVGQGTLQSVVVYVAARFMYGAAFDYDLLGLWTVSCGLSAAAAAALALFVCALCQSRKQAEGLTTFVVLLVSAAGGSMVPRYLMPPWFQEVSWFTPNSWIIEAFEHAVLPGTTVGDLTRIWATLGGMVVGGLVLAVVVESRRRSA